MEENASIAAVLTSRRSKRRRRRRRRLIILRDTISTRDEIFVVETITTINHKYYVRRVTERWPRFRIPSAYAGLAKWFVRDFSPYSRVPISHRLTKRLANCAVTADDLECCVKRRKLTISERLLIFFFFYLHINWYRFGVAFCLHRRTDNPMSHCRCKE